MSDFTPDLADTLHVWNSLEQARDGVNEYGQTVAEVYVQHLLPQKLEVSDGKAVWKQAGKNLNKVLTKFCEMNGVSAHVNGRKIGKWLNDFEICHKCDVSICRPKRKSNGGQAKT